MMMKRVLGAGSRVVAARAALKTKQAKRSYANENKVIADTYKKMGEEIAKSDARSLEKLFFEVFPEAAENPTDANVKQMQAVFSAIYKSTNEAFESNPATVSKGLKRFNQIAGRVLAEQTSGQAPVKVAVTGASGNIGYALLFRIASGAMFGETTPVQIHLLDLPAAQKALQGVVMELQDCAFPLLRGVQTFDDANKAFADIDVALLVGAKPRGPGMERADLLLQNAEIFSVQGKALNAHAKKSVKVAVVGNPANTNAMIAQRNAPSIPAENFTAMTRLDHNRALAQLAAKTGCHVSEVSNFAVWGNHSPTMYPSLVHATIKGRPATEVINDNDWIVKNFIPTVQQRGAAILNARGASSAASAASALVDHVRDWVHGTAGEWTSIGVISKGEYGVTPGLNFSYPIVHAEGKSQIVQNLPLDPFSAEKIEASHKELLAERDAIAKILPK